VAKKKKMSEALVDRMELLHYVAERGGVILNGVPYEMAVGDYKSAYKDNGPEGEAMWAGPEPCPESFTFEMVEQADFGETEVKINGSFIVFLLPATLGEVIKARRGF
jgi:hypothetical protein